MVADALSWKTSVRLSYDCYGLLLDDLPFTGVKLGVKIKTKPYRLNF